jgi:protein SCO1
MTRALALLGLTVMLTAPVLANASPPAIPGPRASRPQQAAGTAAVPTEVAEGLYLETRPRGRLPLDAQVADERGQTVALGTFFSGKPVVLAFQYLRCKTICGVALGQLAEAAAGLDATVVAISIDPRDTPADAGKAKARYAESGAGKWHFLTGPEAAVRPIADAAGFRYRYDPATDQYIHSIGYLVAAADGTISSYLPEVGLAPAQIRTALTATATRQNPAPFERLLLLCFGGAPHGRFTGLIETALVLFNLAGVLAAIGMFAWTRRHRHG